KMKNRRSAEKNRRSAGDPPGFRRERTPAVAAGVGCRGSTAGLRISDNQSMWTAAGFLAALLLSLSAAQAAGEVVPRSPRLIEYFDFEGTDDQGVKLGLGHELPRHFFAMGRDPLVGDRYFYRVP